MNFDPVVVAMVSAFQMLDDASEDEVDPDFAVHMQQMIGAYLEELSGQDLAELRQILTRIAGERSTEDPVIAEYCGRIADGLASRE